MESSPFNWLPDDRYTKLKSQMSLKINTLLATVYSMYGYQSEAAGVTKEIMNIIEESWDIVRGKDKPLPEIDLERWV